MNIKDLSRFGIPENFIKRFRDSGIDKLYDPQAKSIKKGLFDYKSQVISAPTASGKTLIAALASIKQIYDKRSKVVYLVPLVALAAEKYKYFKELFKGTKVKVAMSTGDLDSSSRWLSNYDFIILTTEKCDSLLRHDSRWFKDVGLIVIDEIHLLNDYSRGPTLEITLTRIREISPHSQILSLSATIKNSDELSDWLGSVLVVSDFRPVKLHEGIYLNSQIQFFGGRNYKLDDGIPSEINILKNTLKFDKQVIYFVSTRRNAEALAEKLSLYNLEKNGFKGLKTLSDEVENILENPTRQCRRLSKCVKGGVAFHHAGLLPKQKTLIEENFKKGVLKSICATPTLAMGVNLPAWRIVVRDVKRYYPGYGSRFIPTLEVKQMFGRAGRPDFDTEGESILIAKDDSEAFQLAEKYVLGEPEEIYSKLAVEPVLRMHTLALVSSGFRTEKELYDFFGKTFYAHQYGDLSGLEIKIRNILDMLIEFGFVVQLNETLKPTRIGKRVSELYLDPLTANQIIESLKKSNKKDKGFTYLHLITDTLEMKPFFSVYKKEEETVLQKISASRFLPRIPDEWDLEFEDFMRSVKTAMVLESWINEMGEDKILAAYRVTPGDLRTKLKNTDWLLYALNELGLLLKMREILPEIRKLRVRAKYGVKEELIPLVRLEQIGRVRARKLYRNNLKTIQDLRKAPLRKLSSVLGEKTALKVKDQLGEEVSKSQQKIFGFGEMV
jgi:helicase